MEKINLKWKINIIGILPLIGFLTLTVMGIVSSYKTYHETNILSGKLLVIEAASQLVHETQKERGKTASYMSGGAKMSSVRDQRDTNQKRIDRFGSVLKSSPFSDPYKTLLMESISKIDKVRKKVDSKDTDLKYVLKEYTGVIKSLLNISNSVAGQTFVASVSSGLRGLRIIEDAKESGGKLRANMSGILAKNKPITVKKFNQIITLKGGLVEGLSSNGLILDRTSIELISKFNKSREFKTVNETFNLILNKSKEGSYYRDSGEFFKIITSALNIVSDLTNHQRNNVLQVVQTLNQEALNSLIKMIMIPALVFCFVMFVMFKFSNEITKSLLRISSILEDQARRVSGSSDDMAQVSGQLSEAATEQASSLQETVSSIDEISSMVQRNADSAKSATEVSRKSNEAANMGKKKVEQMIRSIDEISESNIEIMSEMTNNNHEINKIVKVISEIGEKTKVINDIVFQTKLLSFNASVEAARAGEHGKGFAVVAEEVGNLASMSGKAALEITEMLDSSIKQVTSIVENSKQKIEGLVSNGKEKISTGNSVAKECGDALDVILQNVSSVNEMVREVSIASSEQSTGVKEVTMAMQQLDQVAHQNTSAANESSVTASALKEQANDLNSAVFSLIEIVNGNSFESRQATSPRSNQNRGVNVVDISEGKREISQKFSSSAKREGSLKVSGLDTVIPDESDDRFEDL